MDDILIVGAGIGGLTLALELHARGLPCRVFEAAPEIRPLGMGINLQPYATEVYHRLGLLDALAAVAVTTQEFVFFNQHGQEIYSTPAGRFAGNVYPQLSIHRGDLHRVLLHAVRERIGNDRVLTGWRCTGVTQNAQHAIVRFQDSATGETLPDQLGAVAVGADGIHSAIYKTLHPQGPKLRYSGTNMWRGTSLWPNFLSGASMVRAGLPARGKIVIYPIRRNVDGLGNNLVNWVVELDTPTYNTRATNEVGRIEDFAAVFADWRFDWMDVPALLSRATGPVMEFPMMDRDPLTHWSEGRITLMGDAAHPMVPLGSNGAGQAILDAGCLAQHMHEAGDLVDHALKAYEARRLPITANIVLADRVGVVDTMVREVELRTHGQRFKRLDDFITRDELARLSVPDYSQRRYQAVVPA
jgi:2-polyprenyl-6-methoxyphenol hydroxylase-like FAD-dependent oxidoreductase